MQLGIVMDPIAEINYAKDSSLALLLAAQRRGWELSYMEMGDLYLRDGRSHARMRALHVREQADDWFSLGEERDAPLGGLDMILMRKDPPVTQEYLYVTYLLEAAEAEGTLVANAPAGLRDVNEKLFAARFSDWTPTTLVSRDPRRLHALLREQGELILKPLDGMGGRSIVKVRYGEPNATVIIETMTDAGRRFTLAQSYLPQVLEGDKRILVIDGEPAPMAVVRVPAAGEIRANLAAGGGYREGEVSADERRMCARLAGELQQRGLLLVGLDVIGGRLTEINVTSPTCLREYHALYGVDLAEQVLDAMQRRHAQRS